MLRSPLAVATSRFGIGLIRTIFMAYGVEAVETGYGVRSLGNECSQIWVSRALGDRAWP